MANPIAVPSFPWLHLLIATVAKMLAALNLRIETFNGTVAQRRTDEASGAFTSHEAEQVARLRLSEIDLLNEEIALRQELGSTVQAIDTDRSRIAQESNAQLQAAIAKVKKALEKNGFVFPAADDPQGALGVVLMSHKSVREAQAWDDNCRSGALHEFANQNRELLAVAQGKLDRARAKAIATAAI